MKIQQPAMGIMKTSEFGDSKYYKVVCACGQPDHDIDFEVAASSTGVDVNTYVTVKTDYWSEAVSKRYNINNEWLQQWDWFWKGTVNGLVSRLKLTWAVWTRGYVQCETVIAMNEQQALNYAETLKTAIADVKEFKKQ